MINIQEMKQRGIVNVTVNNETVSRPVCWVYLQLDTPDDLDDLVPTSSNYPFTTMLIVAGSELHIISTNEKYMVNSSGVWVIQDEASRMNVYTKPEIDSMLEDYTTTSQQMLIDGAQDADITDLLNAATELIDTGHKNLMLLSGSDVTGYGIQCTFDYASGTISLDGVNPDKKCTGSFNIQCADSRSLGLVAGTLYNFSCGGYDCNNDTIGLYVYTANASPLSQFDCYTNTIAAWNTAWEQASGFRLFIRSGTVVDNVVLKPMICAQSYYKISDKFVPYKP